MRKDVAEGNSTHPDKGQRLEDFQREKGHQTILDTPRYWSDFKRTKWRIIGQGEDMEPDNREETESRKESQKTGTGKRPSYWRLRTDQEEGDQGTSYQQGKKDPATHWQHHQPKDSEDVGTDDHKQNKRQWRKKEPQQSASGATSSPSR